MTHSDSRPVRTHPIFPGILFALLVFAAACTTPSEQTASTGDTESIASKAEQMPAIIGGFEALQKELKYPEQAKRQGIEGRTLVTFTVTELGVVKDAVVASGVENGAALDEEAVRAVETLRFEPGMKDGKPVAVQMTLPVNWRLQ